MNVWKMIPTLWCAGSERGKKTKTARYTRIPSTIDGCCKMTKTSSIAFIHFPFMLKDFHGFLLLTNFPALLTLLEPVPVVLCRTPWISHQFVTRPHKEPNNHNQSLSPLTNLEFLLSLMCIFWTAGVPLRYRNTHATTRKALKKYIPRPGDSADLHQCASLLLSSWVFTEITTKKILNH